MRGDEHVNKNKKGFTLAELLIVVAIIAVLIAISIPIFHAQLKKARLAANQANGRAAFSAAEAGYLDYVAEHGSIEVNQSSKTAGGELYNTVTYTYFPAAGKGILNFHHTVNKDDITKMYDDKTWIVDSKFVYNRDDIDVSSWTVDTVLSDTTKVGDAVATVWTVHMDPSNGQILGYYCAFPKNNDSDYRKVLKAIESGDISNYEQK